MFLRRSKTFLLFATVLFVVLLKETSSKHLKAHKGRAEASVTGICFMTYSQSNWHIDQESNQIYTKHGKCNEVSYVGNALNDAVVHVSFAGECDTCRAELFDDADFRGGAPKILLPKDCTSEWGKGCDLGDIGWSDRVSSLKLCCDKVPERDYQYGGEHTCRFALTEAKAWYKGIPETVYSSPPLGGCREHKYIGEKLNDDLGSIKTAWDCTDCTIQLFDDADLRGDSKTFTVGSDNCRLADTGEASCDLKDWAKRASSFKTCCPTGMQF